jgi:hypothetical protein
MSANGNSISTREVPQLAGSDFERPVWIEVSGRSPTGFGRWR